MTEHLLESEMNDLLDSRLPPEAVNLGLQHLETCSECRQAAERLSSVIAAAAELRTPMMPADDLWPAVARRTVQRSWFRGPWLFTLILSVVVVVGTSVWLERTRPWERIATRVVSEPEYRASDAEILRLLAGFDAPMSDDTKRRELDRLAPAVFRSANPEVRTRFFESVRSIQSDAEKRQLLVFLMSHAADTTVAAALIEAARTIGSSSDKAEVLASLAGEPSMKNESLRLSYLDAVETISSERARALARSALLSR